MSIVLIEGEQRKVANARCLRARTNSEAALQSIGRIRNVLAHSELGKRNWIVTQVCNHLHRRKKNVVVQRARRI